MVLFEVIVERSLVSIVWIPSQVLTFYLLQISESSDKPRNKNGLLCFICIILISCMQFLFFVTIVFGTDFIWTMKYAYFLINREYLYYESIRFLACQRLLCSTILFLKIIIYCYMYKVHYMNKSVCFINRYPMSIYFKNTQKCGPSSLHSFNAFVKCVLLLNYR